MVSPTDGEKFERLPHKVVPFHYDLHMKPNLTTFVFEGEETIHVELLESLNHITFYSKDIDIKHVQVTAGGESLSEVPFEYDIRWEKVTLKLAKPMGPGKAAISIKFTGTHNDHMRGFYKSNYKDSEGKELIMATTQFESTKARMAFPCFDEPAYKATFDVVLTVPKDKTALSCTRVKSEVVNDDGTKSVTYMTTPIMSTYLMAFCVADLDFLEGTTKEGVRVRVYTPPGKSALAEFALEVATKALPFFANYFNIPYTLDKCDLVAVADFEMGAMENWGLVTFREVCLLYDPKTSSGRIKERITETVSHELAHMWFGDLATMKWWEGLWLKEGFATFMAYMFTGEHYPEFDIWNQFIQAETLASMSLDSLKSSHPIEVPIDDPSEIDEIYDAISYEKSASILRMLECYLGKEMFRDGLRCYLSKFQFKNADTKDLWDCLTSVTKQDIEAVMTNWTKVMGFPVVKVSRKDVGGKTILSLTQTRFIADGSDDPLHTVWQVPIVISTAKDPKAIVHRSLLKEKTGEIILENVGPNDWIKLNPGFVSYHRVQYSEDMLALLASAVPTGVFSAVDRFSLTNDLFALVVAGRASSVSYLQLLENYKGEEEYTVWSDIIGGVGHLSTVLEETEWSDQYDSYICSVFHDIAKKVGWDPKPGEGHTTALLRALLFIMLGRSGDESVVNEAFRRFKQYREDPNSVSPDLRSRVFAVTGKYGGAKAFDAVTEIHNKTDSSEVQRDCQLCLGRSNDKQLQQKALAFAMSDKCRPQDIYLPVFGVTAAKGGKESAWHFFQENFQKFIDRCGSAGSPLMKQLIQICTQSFATEEKAKEVEAFFGSVERHPAMARPIEQSLENIRLNATLLKRDGEAVGHWLTTKGYKAKPPVKVSADF